MTAPRCYADIKRLSRETGKPVPELLGMSSRNDPFYIMPSQERQALWFADLWTRFNLPAGTHLRRIHYKLLSQAGLELPDGTQYENTTRAWALLLDSSKAARCLRLVPAEAFIDARNPEPTLTRDYPDDAPRLIIDEVEPWTLPTISDDLGAGIDWRLPDVWTVGYGASGHADPAHLELISEKSTMDDIIVPLCRSLGINYAPATGFQSMIGTINLLKRAAKSGKPCVVFYVSDFDPAGDFMPASVARQIEYWRPLVAPDTGVLLVRALLTAEQVAEYQLPPIPIKTTDRRQDNFLARHDVQGATELDALEALHPGALKQIVRHAVKPYRDPDAWRESCRLAEEADALARDQWAEACAPHEAQLEELKARATKILDGYTERLSQLKAQLAADLAPLAAEVQAVRHAVKTEAARFDPELPARYVSPLALPTPAQFAGLFDSRRGYLEQLPYYKRTAPDEAPE